MKVLIVTDFFGNDLTYIENELAKQYIKFGLEVSVICSLTDNPFDFFNDNYHSHKKKSVQVSNGIKVYRLPYKINIKKRIKKFKGVYEILTQEKPDIIFFNSIQPDIKEAVKYKNETGCNIILYSETDYSNSANNWVSLNVLHKIIWKTVFHRYKKHISKIFFATPASSDFLKNVYNISDNETELLPLGCDYELSENVRNTFDKDGFRKKMGINNSDHVLITGGKLNPKKKTEIIIEAVNMLKRSDLHLIIFGTPDNGFERYYEHLKKIGQNANIHFTGWLSPDSFYEHMAISDVAVFPSSQSVLWQQAIGMHLPLIAGDSGWQDMSYLNFYDNIVKIEKDNITPIIFADVVNQLISSPDNLIKMKRGAEKAAKEHLNYTILAKKTLEGSDHNFSK